jgi:hypothetical protein
MAGGEAHIFEKKGKRYFHERHRLRGRQVVDVRPQLHRDCSWC